MRLQCTRSWVQPPDTTASGLDNDARTIHMAVAFRYVDTTTPIDGTATSSSGAGGDPRSSFDDDRDQQRTSLYLRCAG